MDNALNEALKEGGISFELSTKVPVFSPLFIQIIQIG